jgi:hypothetical protein
MDIFDFAGNVMMGVGAGTIGIVVFLGGKKVISDFISDRRTKRFDRYIAQLRAEADDAVRKIQSHQPLMDAMRSHVSPELSQEISEFTYRGSDGNLDTVKIIIDHGLDDVAGASGIQGTIEDITGDQSTVEDSRMHGIKEFVFSANAVRDMRMAGIEPDEVVVKMLKASGRM